MNTLDSVLINVPISSPLHPQANLPFLKGFLKQNGFKTKIYDTNIKFLNWFLAEQSFNIKNMEYMKNPVELLKLYNDIEHVLYEKCKSYRNLTIGLRNISLDYSRTTFDSVLKAVEDKSANPFIDFYNEFIDKHILPDIPKIIGIGIIFQDQIIAAFTLAHVIRERFPEVKIVLGGQIITRCYDTLLESGLLNHLWDYLVLWDGEMPLLDIHRKVINKSRVPMINIIEKKEKNLIDRSKYAYDLNNLECPDFSDLDFNEYLFPEMLFPLQTARGCYGSCEFCAIPAGSNNSFRQRKADKIIDDILSIQEHTLKTYGKKAVYFKFMDDTSSPKTLLAVAREIKSRSIEAQWETFVRLEKDFEDADFMEQLYQGGCRKLMWGLETNNPDILKNMRKKINVASIDKILQAVSKAGIINFVFVLLGFPGETKEQRDKLAEYIINNKDIHVLTIATFDVTKNSPIQKNFVHPNVWGIEIDKPGGFEVRLPYTVKGENWKKMIVAEAHRILVKIIKERPDIGFMSLFPDQARGILGNKYGNGWGREFLSDFGQDNIRQLLLSTESYIDSFANQEEIELSLLPEPIKREHMRTSEDIKAVAEAISARKKYEERRMKQV
ncbi:MAG: radical SAM protein [Candidatus Omnitrophota bacterium]|nr:MAG: radical SAM protein [Candidatus Omnitrophota bacterium]